MFWLMLEVVGLVTIMVRFLIVDVLPHMTLFWEGDRFIKRVFSYLLIIISVRKIRLIQTYGNHPRGGVNRVMVSFCKFKLCECKRQLYASI